MCLGRRNQEHDVFFIPLGLCQALIQRGVSPDMCGVHHPEAGFFHKLRSNAQCMWTGEIMASHTSS